MTGILPIKKEDTQSAISDFEEDSVLEPGNFAAYFGFTEEKVKLICEAKNLDFEKMKFWYDGYTFGEQHFVYNPYSVMQATGSGQFRPYWKKTTAAETLMTYMEQDDLQNTIARLTAREQVVVDTDSFRNDIETFTCRDDVLTLLAHLGYLTYEEKSDSYDDDLVAGLVRIPNEEVRSEFEQILRRTIT